MLDQWLEEYILITTTEGSKFKAKLKAYDDRGIMVELHTRKDAPEPFTGITEARTTLIYLPMIRIKALLQATKVGIR